MYVFFYMCVLFVMCMKVRLLEEGQGACVRHFPRISKYCAIFLIKFVEFLFLLSQKKKVHGPSQPARGCMFGSLTGSSMLVVVRP